MSTDKLTKYRYLLGQTELFKDFIPEEKLKQLATQKKGQKTQGARFNATYDNNDPEIDEDFLEESPAYIKGTLKDYQVHGLNWLVNLYNHQINGILADEMGLGKTIQSISLIGYLKYIKEIDGIHLVIAPKSTLDNWQKEFKKFSDIDVFVLHGDKETRANLIENRLKEENFDVCITSYEIVLREKSVFGKMPWHTLIIDEAHRIKNAESQLSTITRGFRAKFKLLLTGTPLQNNLKELWALLYFLMDDIFNDSEKFEQWVLNGEGNEDGKIQQLHKILRPFMLRRLKSDVEHSLPPKKRMNLYVKMVPMQKKWYRAILEKNIDAVNGVVGSKKEKKTRLLNIVMQLRKCTNHPYLFQGAEPGPPYTTDIHLVENCAKMKLLDKLLLKFKANGQKVLVFSQMARMLDILEDYCLWRQFQYCRIDGQTAHEDRIDAIDAFNDNGEDKFVFLLTTRAGGLGINLTSANVVIMYDSDWNPQVDLQAEDRAHRIGQTKQVFVYKLVTENAIDEKILERAQQKLQLDKMVIQQGKLNHQAKEGDNDYLAMIQHGVTEVFNEEDPINIDEDIDDILKLGEEKTLKLNNKFENVRIEDLLRLESSIDAIQFAAKRGAGAAGLSYIEPSKRERKNYIYSEKGRRQQQAPRPPNQLSLLEFQFYPTRVHELQKKETLFYQKEMGYRVPLQLVDDDDTTEEQLLADQARDQEKIDNAEDLTTEEKTELEHLSNYGFKNWGVRDYRAFIKACEKYGRSSIVDICADMERIGKAEDEVKRYHEVFFERWSELSDFEKISKQIEKGEEKLRKSEEIQSRLKSIVESYKYPMYQIKLPQASGRKNFTEEEDRFIVF
eukprot:NODE_4_length_77007_cov_1.156642.p3 type:complete len:842 gc:universal NODE_4_length_77007_cov_1.156642:15271-12746(-)